MKIPSKNSFFSIIIPNFNGWKFIEGCILSILRQEYEHYEIIVVDGKSVDNSHSIIASYAECYPGVIRWINEKDTGISGGFNIGIAHAKWDFVLLLGSDDYLYDGILKKMNVFIQTIREYDSIDIENCSFFCDSINYWTEKSDFRIRMPQTSDFTITNLIRYGNIVWFQNIYINRKWFESYKINEQNKYSMDYETYFEMLKSGQKFVYFHEINSIDALWDNTTCKYWYASQKEANTVSARYASSLLDRFFIMKRFCTREIRKWLIK